MSQIARSDRATRLRTALVGLVGVLFVKVLLEILYEYRWYFPANFDASFFLLGRRPTFVGLYRAAFYAHIVSGPLTVVLGSFLIFSGGRPGYWKLHRPLGRLQMLIVMAFVVPSGLVMATQAYTGPIAAWGFGMHSIATGVCAVAAVWFAISRKFDAHRQWASRCFVLLCSPLLLRVVSGATIVMQIDSDTTYRLTAWLSWLIPLAIYEWWSRGSVRTRLNRPATSNPLNRSLIKDEAFQ